MLFTNIRQKIKNSKLSMTQVVTASLLFVIFSDKNFVYNLINDISNMFANIGNSFTLGCCPFECLFTSMVNLSRLFIFEYSITMGISYMFWNLALIVAIAVTVLYILNFKSREETVLESNYSISHVESKVTSSNNIYLITNKLIC